MSAAVVVETHAREAEEEEEEEEDARSWLCHMLVQSILLHLRNPHGVRPARAYGRSLLRTNEMEADEEEVAAMRMEEAEMEEATIVWELEEVEAVRHFPLNVCHHHTQHASKQCQHHSYSPPRASSSRHHHHHRRFSSRNMAVEALVHRSEGHVRR